MAEKWDNISAKFMPHMDAWRAEARKAVDQYKGEQTNPAQDYMATWSSHSQYMDKLYEKYKDKKITYDDLREISINQEHEGKDKILTPGEILELRRRWNAYSIADTRLANVVDEAIERHFDGSIRSDGSRSLTEDSINALASIESSIKGELSESAEQNPQYKILQPDIASATIAEIEAQVTQQNKSLIDQIKTDEQRWAKFRNLTLQNPIAQNPNARLGTDVSKMLQADFRHDDAKLRAALERALSTSKLKGLAEDGQLTEIGKRELNAFMTHVEGPDPLPPLPTTAKPSTKGVQKQK